MTAAPLLDTATDTTLTARALAAALRPITKITKARALPILTGVRLTAGGGTVCLRAFDYEISIHTELPGAYTGPTLDVVVDAKSLAGFLAGDKTGMPVELRCGADGLTVGYGAATLTLATLDLDELPALPAPAGEPAFHLAGAELARLLKGAQASAGGDDTLPVLTGVQLDLTDRVLTAVATDRYRLGWSELILHPQDCHEASFQALIPVSSLAIAMAACGPNAGVMIGRTEAPVAAVSFETEHTTVTVRTLDGQFPKWRSLLPGSATTTITVDRKALATAVKTMAAAVAPASRHGLQLALMLRTGTDGLTLSTLPGADQQAATSITAGYACAGDSIEWGFSPHYLLALLEAIEGPTVTIALTSPVKPFVLTGTGTFQALLMPVKLPA